MSQPLRAFSIVLAVVCAVAPSSSYGQTAVSAPATVHTTTAGAQSGPEVSRAWGADGRYVAAWTSEGQDGDQGGIVARVFAADGSPLTGEIPVNATTAGDQRGPQVAVGADGGFVVVWTSSDGDGDGVFLRRFDASGAPLGGEVPVNTTIAGSQTLPAVAVNAAGTVLVMWTSEGQDGSGAAVVGRRFHPGGAPMGGEFVGNATTAGDQTRPAVAAAKGDGFWFAYESDGAILLRRLTREVGTLSPEVVVGAATAGRRTWPAVGIAHSGTLVVAWQVDTPRDDIGGEIRAQRFEADGAPAGGNIHVNAFRPGAQSAPRLAVHPDGSFLVSWTSAQQDQSGQGMFARSFTADGVGAAKDFRITPLAAGDQGPGALVVLPDGEFQAVTQQGPAFGADTDGAVVSQRWRANELPNGSFESAMGGVWLGTNIDPTGARDCTRALLGACSARVEGATGQSRHLSQVVTVDGGAAGDAWVLSGSSRTMGASAAGGSIAVRARVIHLDGTIQQHVVAFDKDTHDWQGRSVRFVTSKPYDFVLVQVVYENQAGTAWFDEVRLARAGDVAPSVTYTGPAAGETDVLADRSLEVVFSERVIAAPGAFVLECPAATPHAISVSAGVPQGVAFTLDPDTDLPYNTTCTLRVVAALVTDEDGDDPPDAMAADVVVTFETLADEPPSVTGSTPASGAIHVAEDVSVVLDFSEPVDVAAGAVSLECPVGTPQAFTAIPALPAAGLVQLTLDPTASLPAGPCEVRVLAGGVTDVDTIDPPDTMETDFVLAFDVDRRPTVDATTPAAGATGVVTDTNVVIEFSEQVNVTASAFTLECPVGTPVPFTILPSPPGDSVLFTLDPAADLPAGTTCTVTVVAAEVTDSDAGDPPDTMAANHVFTFTTDAAPDVQAITPPHGAVNVAVDASVTVDFTEPVNATAASFTLECPLGTPRTFVVSPMGAAMSFTLVPDALLPEGTACTVTVLANNVTDADLFDPPDVMPANRVFTFTTDAAPEVLSTVPADGAIDVPLNGDLTVTFTESVSVTASAFTLECPDGTPFPFVNTTGLGPATTFTLDPTGNLPINTACVLTVVGAEVSDTDAGDPPNLMTADEVVTFTTVNDAPPVVQATSPVDGADTIAAGANVTVTFSEAVDVTAGAFALECPIGTPHAYTLSPPVPGGATSFTLDPDTDLPFGTACRVTVVASEVTDVDVIDPPDQMDANHVFAFTVDHQPSVLAISPSDGAGNRPADTNVVVTFSEPVDVTTSSFTLQCPAPGNLQTFAVSGSGTAAITLDPAADLPSGSTCTVTVVANQVSDSDAGDPPDHMAADFTSTFGVDAAPFVFSTTPGNGDVQIGTTANLAVNFSEQVNVTGSAFDLQCPVGTPIPVTNTTGGTVVSAILDPNVTLPENTVCQLTVVAAQVNDTDLSDPPDFMAADHVVTFTTDAAPAVTTTTPSNGAIGVDGTADIVVNFTEPVTVTTSSFSIACPVGSPQTFAVSGSGTASITLNPDATLPGGTTCTVTAVAANISDVDAGDPPDHPAADHVFSFDTDAPPSVTATSPVNGATDQRTDINIVVTFSEPVTATSSSFTLECPAAGNLQAFGLSGSGTAVLTLDPTVNLPAGTACTVTVLANQISDVDANDPPDNMAANYVFSFTTDAAPAVLTTTPANGAANQATNANVVLQFTEPVTVSLSSFTIECPAVGNLQPYALSGSGTSTITLDPTANLPAGVTCTVTAVASQISDVDANDPPDTMAANHVFTFSTDAAPSVVTITPSAGAVQVAANTNITIGFSENVNITAGAFTLACPVGSPQPFTVSPVAPGGVASYTLDSVSDLPFGTTCTVTTVATEVTDVDANDPPDQMAANHVFTFTVDAAPTVVSTVPADGALSQAKATNIAITFSEAVNATASAFTIQCPSGGANRSYALAGNGTSTLTLNPDSDLPDGVVCEVTVVGSQISDTDAGDPPDTMVANHVFDFGVAPFADDDSFGVTGNVNIAVPAGSGVLVGDLGPSITVSEVNGLTANVGVSVTTSGSGTLVVAADGSFTFNPAPNSVAADSFTYRVSNAAGTSNLATVTLTLANRIIFVNNAGPAGDGRLATPFNTLAPADAVAAIAAADVIFLYTGSGADYTGGVTLNANQHLVGQGVSLAGVLPFTLAAHSAALPGTGTKPPVAQTIVLGNDSDVRGLVAKSTSAAAISATNVSGTNDVDTVDVTPSGTGGGISVSSQQAGNVFNLAATSTLSSTGSGNAVLLSGGSGTVDINPALSQTGGGRIVNIQSRTGGTVTIDGDLTCATNCAGISVSNSAGSVAFTAGTKALSTGASNALDLTANTGTIAFTNGGLVITTTSGVGFNATHATGGGTVTVAAGGSANTIDSTSAAALNVDNVTIGSDNLNFQKISSGNNTAAADPVNGIMLRNTGAGRLIVSGNGSACSSLATCTGGAIQNTTGHGISLTTTNHPSFTRVAIQNAGRSGVDGSGVTSFTFQNGFIDNVGTGAHGQYDESNLSFNDNGAFTAAVLTGTVTISNNTLRNARRHGVQIENGSGTISNLLIQGNTVTSSSVATTSLGTAILVLQQGSAGTASHLTTGTISGNTITHFPSGEGIAILGGTGNSTNNTSATLGASGTPISITSNSVSGGTGSQRTGSNAIRASMNSQVGVMNFTISNNNPLTNIEGQGISVFVGGTITGSTSIAGNTIVANQTLAAGTQGLAVQVDDGPAGLGTSAADYNVIITGNSVSNYEGSGIRAIARASLGKLDVTIQNNVVGTPILANRHGIRVDGGSAAGDTNVCVLMSGNTSDGSGSSQGIGIRKQGAVATVNDFGIVGLAPSPSTAANAAAKVNADNPAGGGVDVLSGDNFVSCTITP